MKSSSLAKCSETLRVLGNSKRLEILYFLKDKELNVGQLERCVKLSQSALSQHLAVLRKAEIVKTRRVAQSVFYCLKDGKTIQLLELLQKIYL